MTTTTFAKRHAEQDIEQVAGIISKWWHMEEAYGSGAAEEARKIDRGDGWGFDVRYADHEYLDDNSYTRVVGLKLGVRDIERAITLAEQWAR